MTAESFLPPVKVRKGALTLLCDPLGSPACGRMIEQDANLIEEDCLNQLSMIPGGVL